jgi:glycosyltransferase involved in cell wall biosynthesis
MARVLLAFEPPDGGVTENVLQLAPGLVAHGHEVEVAGPADAIVYAALEAAGVPVHRTAQSRSYRRPDRELQALRELAGLVRRRRIDLLHAHASKAGVLGRLAARVAGVPAVYTPHCFPFIGEFGTPRRIAATAAERALAPRTAAIVCVADWERRIALEKRIAPAAKLHVIHNGSPPCDPAAEPDPALLALRGDGVLVGAVSVMRRQKTLEVFLDAVPRILEAVPEARCALVGEGPEERMLRDRATALGLDANPRFAFLPFAPPAARHLRALDVYVLPSSWEAFPIAVLEALACGTPQVATEVGGTGEALSAETGVLVPPHDPAAIAAATVELLRDPERRAAMSEASVERHAQRFGVERMVAETAGLYRAVLSRTSRPRPSRGRA